MRLKLAETTGNGGLNQLNYKLMDAQAKATAIELISNSPSCVAKFHTPVEDNYSNTYEILIIESNATLLTELVRLGYSLFMTKKGLSVCYFGVSTK